jgi:hypothetical protein
LGEKQSQPKMKRHGGKPTWTGKRANFSRKGVEERNANLDGGKQINLSS